VEDLRWYILSRLSDASEDIKYSAGTGGYPSTHLDHWLVTVTLRHVSPSIVGQDVFAWPGNVIADSLRDVGPAPSVKGWDRLHCMIGSVLGPFLAITVLDHFDGRLRPLFFPIGEEMVDDVSKIKGVLGWEAILCIVRDTIPYDLRGEISEVLTPGLAYGPSHWHAVQVAEVTPGLGYGPSHRIRDALLQEFNEQLKHFISPYLWGAFSAGYFSFYDYIEQVLGVDFDTDFWPIYRDTCEMGPAWMMEGVCVVSDRPRKIEMRDGQLHCDDGPAVEYRDGFSIYALNGVRVPAEIVDTPIDELGSHIIVETRNAEVRREIVRRIGIERVMEELGGECMDKDGDYELRLLDIGDDKYPYLKMKNPSTGEWHVEFVHPGCNTVREALTWRNWGLQNDPLQLT
jgi:hypothetical protein